MEQGTLIIFSGLPGSGKSTLSQGLSRRIGASYVRIDTVEQGLKDIRKMSKVEGEGYRLSYKIVRDNLICGHTVIADSVNPIELTRREWNNVAQEVGAHYHNIEIVCTDLDQHRMRLESRGKTPGIRQPTWEDVQNREFEPWDGSQITIDTAGKTVDQSLEELMTALKAAI